MRIFIIGAGFTGTQLARTLVAEKNSVVLIDNDPERVRHAGDQLDGTVIEGDGNNLETLEKAGIASADVLVTLTEDDEINMITCSLVDAVYPEILKIARVRNYAYYLHTTDAARRLAKMNPSGSRQIFGIDHMLNPDVEAADAIGQAMELGAVGNVVELGRGFGIVTLPICDGSPMAGVPIRAVAAMEGWRFLVAFIEGEDSPTLPSGSTVLQVGDSVGILARTEDIPALLPFTGTTGGLLRKIAIFGADRVGSLIAERQMEKRRETLWTALFGRGTSFLKEPDYIVIDRDPERCRDIAERFPAAHVLCGDITDDTLLQEEGLCDCDLMVAASGNHERNLITAAYLKSRGAKKAIALTADSTFNEIARKLGVDVAVPMRDTVVDAVMSHLRGRNVSAVHSICGRRFEIVECDIAPDSKAAGRPLQKLAAPGEYLVLLIRQPDEKEWQVPRGDTVMQGGAHLVLITPAGDRRTLRLFCGRE